MALIRSTYTYSFEDNVHVIVDENHGKSVTNDADEVIRDLYRANADLRLPVIYRDSMGQYDRLLVRDNKFAGFAPLRTRDRAMALRIVAMLEDA